MEWKKENNKNTLKESKRKKSFFFQSYSYFVLLWEIQTAKGKEGGGKMEKRREKSLARVEKNRQQRKPIELI